MKISRLFNSLPKRLAAGALIALGIAFPVAVSAAQTVAISATTGVANVTAGDTSYNSSVNAAYDQVVKVEVTYDNTEAPGSNLVASNVHVKFNVPTAAGSTQVITTTTGGDNTNTVNGQATVNLSQSNAYLQYITGSAQANITNPDGTISSVVVPDSDILSAQGYLINNGNPCQAAAVAIEARVMVPGVTIVKQVKVDGSSQTWSQTNTANIGDTLDYLISYTNTGNTTQNNVIISDNLPPGLSLVPNSTYLADPTNPSGILYNSNNVASGGINIGNYGPGQNAFVKFQVTLPAASAMSCGQNEYRNVGVAYVSNLGYYQNTAITDVNKSCASTPTYTCNNFVVTTGANRTATVSQFNETATNGATFNNLVINWGDNTAPLTTNNVIGQSHQYANDGTYTLTAVAHFTLNGQDVTASGASCTQTITFATPAVTTVSTTSTPSALPNTGPGNVLALFAGTTVAGAIAYRLFIVRRLAHRG